MKNIYILRYYLACNKGPSNDDVWVANGTVFQEMRAGAGSKTGDFVQEKLGGGTVGTARNLPPKNRVRAVIKGLQYSSACSDGLVVA